ncbi:MAG: pilus assembly protein PilP, partial [Myxococcota bacterium]
GMTPRLSIALLLALAACGEPVATSGGSTLTPKPPAARAEGADAASAQANEDFYYNPAGKRDPFQSFIKRGKADELRPDAPPLQRWDIDKYTLRGVIWDTQAPRALMVDPEGTGHVIKLGTYVGRNWGKVTSISEGCVVITEEYQTLDGELVVNPVTACFAAEARK